MSQKVLQQIQYLCKEINTVEWSGILFYKTLGSIRKPEEMVITLEDILPMHKGSTTFTEYSFDESVIEYLVKNPHLEGCLIGHLHSHHDMNVYFSSTDLSELEDNAPNHNIYTSLIVNNEMDFAAKVAFLAKAKVKNTIIYEAKDEKGERYEYSEDKKGSLKDRLIMFDCDIEAPESFITKNFISKVKYIISKDTKKINCPTLYNNLVNNTKDSKKEEINLNVIEDFLLYIIYGGREEKEYLHPTEIFEDILFNYYENYSEYMSKYKDYNNIETHIFVLENIIQLLESDSGTKRIPFTITGLKLLVKGFTTILNRLKNKKYE